MRPTSILVAVDGSEHAQRAIQWAVDLAQCHDAPLSLVHVMRWTGSNRVPRELEEFERIEHVRITERDLLESAAAKILDAAKAAATDAGVGEVATFLRNGDPASEIIGVADEVGADLVVMGSRGLSDLPGLVLGSVSHRVVHAAEGRAVLTVR